MRDEYDELQEQTHRRYWERVSADQIEPPIQVGLPYVELKLEHPDVEPTQFSNSFFPDVVPYQIGAEHRIFYWRSALSAGHAPLAQWAGVCATAHRVEPITTGKSMAPTLVTTADATHVVVVDGIIGGESTEAILSQYEPPRILVDRVTADAVVLDTPAGRRRVSSGNREQIELLPQRVRVGDSKKRICVTPQLHIRYPGQRVVYHPAPDATYALFPSFGLTLDDVPNPVSIPQTGDDLDDTALTAAFGVDLSARPYAERVLWQAFAYTSFSPHRESPPQLAQLDSGLLAVLNPS